jgi:hypothetical protein
MTQCCPKRKWIYVRRCGECSYEDRSEVEVRPGTTMDVMWVCPHSSKGCEGYLSDRYEEKAGCNRSSCRQPEMKDLL